LDRDTVVKQINTSNGIPYEELTNDDIIELWLEDSILEDYYIDMIREKLQDETSYPIGDFSIGPVVVIK